MPIDSAGNRADIVMDGNATINRMNIGRLYELYINAASRDVASKIRSDLGISPLDVGIDKKITALETSNPGLVDNVWNYLLGYYNIVSPKMYVWFTDGEYRGTRVEHLTSVVTKGIYLYMPPDLQKEYTVIIQELQQKYPPTYGPVTYIGNSGKRVTTKDPIRIGSLYMMLLEKTGDDWTAVSSGKLQHFGVLSQVINTDKYAQPSRNQAIRALGESEVRIYASYAGAKITAEVHDRNNNPSAHRSILREILGAQYPTNIDNTIDRKKYPLGMSRPLSLVNHMLQCSGTEFSYKEYVPEWTRNPSL